MEQKWRLNSQVTTFPEVDIVTLTLFLQEGEQFPGRVFEVFSIRNKMLPLEKMKLETMFHHL